MLNRKQSGSSSSTSGNSLLNGFVAVAEEEQLLQLEIREKNIRDAREVVTLLLLTNSTTQFDQLFINLSSPIFFYQAFQKKNSQTLTNTEKRKSQRIIKSRADKKAKVINFTRKKKYVIIVDNLLTSHYDILFESRYPMIPFSFLVLGAH